MSLNRFILDQKKPPKNKIQNKKQKTKQLNLKFLIDERQIRKSNTNICKHLFHKLKKYNKKLIQIKKKLQFQNILTYIIHQN